MFIFVYNWLILLNPVTHAVTLSNVCKQVATLICIYVPYFVFVFYATVPVPSVTVSTLKDQIVGQSLLLKCNITTVRGITSRVDVIWSSDGLELRRTEGINARLVLTESLLYSNSYTISQLRYSR